MLCWHEAMDEEREEERSSCREEMREMFWWEDTSSVQFCHVAV